jgi:hypothetical protein
MDVRVSSKDVVIDDGWICILNARRTCKKLSLIEKELIRSQVARLEIVWQGTPLNT